MATLMLSVSGARGIVGDGLDAAEAWRLALAFDRVAAPGPVLLGRDSRPSGPGLAAAAAAAVRSAGRAVEDLGLVTTPTVQVAVKSGGAGGGIVVTASHNPPQWNALKFVGAGGAFLDAAAMRRLIDLFGATPPPADPPPALRAPSRPAGAAESAAGEEEAGADARSRPPSAGGELAPEAFRAGVTPAGLAAVDEHVRLILRDADEDRIRAAGLRVVVDAVHGAGGVLVAPLLARLGVAVEWIDGEPDGRLPERPEPRAERLGPLAARVAEAGADLGFALDPDGDRCAPVLPGRPLGEEWALPLCAYARLAAGGRGPLVTNLSTSSRLEWLGERFGVQVHRAPVGEAHVVGRMRALGALIGGEGNGGVIDPRVHLGRDAGVAIARLLELESGGPGGRGGLTAAAALFPPLVLLKREVEIGREALEALAGALVALWGEPANREDGYRWAWPRGWAHLRPSGTEPIVRIMVEAPEQEEAEARIAEARGAAQAAARGPARGSTRGGPRDAAGEGGRE